MHDDSVFPLTSSTLFENLRYEEFPQSSSFPVQHEIMLSLLYDITNDGAALDICSPH